jgi:transcriptional regulator with XRE-family HTH domain
MQRSYLADLELGRRNPSVRTLVRVANAFGIAVLELFEGEVKRRSRYPPPLPWWSYPIPNCTPSS